MGKIKDWVIQMEEDAAELTLVMSGEGSDIWH